MEVRRLLRVAPPTQEGFAGRLVPGGKKGVGSDYASEASFVLGSEPQANQPAPILADKRDVPEIQRRDQAIHPIDVALVGVILTPRRLIRAPEAYQIGHDGTIASSGNNRDHLTIEIAPGWLPVQHQDRLGIFGAFINILFAQEGAYDIVRGKVVAG